MGLQFENLVTYNYKTLWEMLNLSAEDVVMDGPFFQSSTTKQHGCQIDYMVQTRFHTLYLCEVKCKKLMKKSFTERMEIYPELKKHMEEMLDVVENIGGKADTANDAEMQVVYNMRKEAAKRLSVCLLLKF